MVDCTKTDGWVIIFAAESAKRTVKPAPENTLTNGVEGKLFLLFLPLTSSLEFK